jgi:ABC-2 type transport system ATP-binding protein
MADTKSLFDVVKLQKYENGKSLMEDVSVSLHEGEIFALVGESSSGKTLLAKIIVNLSLKTGGKIKIHNQNYVGLFLRKEQFLPTDTMLEVIKDYCRLNNKVFNIKKVKNILNACGIKKKMNNKINTLSPAEIDLLKIAIPIIVKSNIIIFDSPFTNFTYLNKRELKVIFKALGNILKTGIIITANKMNECEEICDTVGIIDDGMLISIKTYNEMIAANPQSTKIAVRTPYPNFAAKVIDADLKLQTKICGDEVLVNTPPENAQTVIDGLLAKKVTVISARKVHKSLQEEYYRIIQNHRAYF